MVGFLGGFNLTLLGTLRGSGVQKCFVISVSPLGVSGRGTQKFPGFSYFKIPDCLGGR